MSRPLICGEGRKADADTHLAAARSQNTGTGILGYTKDKRQPCKRLSFYNIYLVGSKGYLA